MYQLAITFNNCYWERNRERDRLRNIEKKAADSHHQKQGKMTQYSASLQSSALPRSQSSTTPPQTAPSQSSLKPPRTSSSIAKSPSSSTPHVDLSNKLGRDGKLNGERVQKRIAHWDKQNHTVPAPNCMLKVQEEIIKVEGL